MKTRKCVNCEKILPEECFYRHNGRVKTTRCKPCYVIYMKEYNSNRKEIINTQRKIARAKKREELKDQKEKERAIRREIRKQKQKEIQRKRFEKIKNTPEYKERQREKRKKRYEKPQNKIKAAISRGILRSLREQKANRHWEELVGYTIMELMAHLQDKFTDKMNWENYGSFWHIDHITPHSWFDIDTTDSDAFKKCWSLDNLQPLEAEKNIKKGNRFSG